MANIRFYHLQNQNIEQALPALVTKALAQGYRIVIKTADEKAAEFLNEYLWTYNAESFLPHGTAKDGFEQRQPVFLTSTNDNPANAEVLIVAGGETPEDLSAYTLACEMLDGKNDSAIADARTRWKAYKQAGHNITYWQQTPQGGWEEKT